MEFSTSGIIFMVATWVAIILLNVFCFSKVLGKKSEKK